MDSNPLPNLLHEIIEWCSQSEFPTGVQISWSLTQLQTLLCYFSQVEVNHDISFRVCEKLHLSEAWQDRSKPQVYKTTAQLVLTFLQDLGELFKAPKLLPISHTDCTLKKNELVAGFICFLLQLLLANADEKDCLVKELTFLITILADQPFRHTGHEQVQRILAEFELLANKVGAEVHSIVFIPVAATTTMDEAVGTLYEDIHHLKAKLTKYLDLFPDIVGTPLLNADEGSFYIVGSLMCSLEDLMNLNDNPIFEVKDQIKTLHQWLKRCHSLLNLPQCIVNEALKKEPLTQVIAVAHNAEYLINSFLVGDLPLWYLTIRFTHHISKIEFYAIRLQEMEHDTNFKALKVADDFSKNLSLQGERDCMVDDTIIGLEKQERNLLDQLVQGTNKLEKILIFGMPGIGKTTLARRMHCHPLVNCHFDKVSWCVVSQMHQRKGLLFNILICIRNDLEDTIGELDEVDLELEIYQSLKDRRYLIVIDDVWDSKVWDDLQFLPDDRNGSKILITSRNKDVAPFGSIIIELPLLSSDQSWELLRKKVFQKRFCPPQLPEIGKKIAANCHGLPLAVVVVAGILSAKEEEESIWKNVEQHLDCYLLSDKSNSMMQILEFSYKYLPHYLKPCFLYFGVFKEDEEIHVKELIQLWIALGYIFKEEKRNAECIAKEYLANLIDRCLVTVVKRRSDGGAKVCVIHDLLRDLCLRIVQKENFLKLINSDFYIWNQRYLHLGDGKQYGASEISMKPCSHQVFSYFWNWESLLHALRILPCISVCSYWSSSFSIVNMKLLRSLVIDMEYDLMGMEFLVHLRYLNVVKMPMSLHKYVNLEYLIVHDEVYITSEILKMAKLKYIWAEEGIYIDGGCDVSSTRSKLEYLSWVCMFNLKELEMLKCVPNLCKLKFQYGRASIEPEPLPCHDLQFLTHLQSLKMFDFSWSSGFNEIKFPSNITKLTLGSLRISQKIMSAIGALPYLQVLKLLSLWGIEEGRWDTIDGEFQQLRILKLRFLSMTTQWNVSSNQHFPKLQQLILEDCFNLKEIPNEIGEIDTLQLIEVRGKCQKSLMESSIRILEEQHDMGNQSLRVDILRVDILNREW